MFCAMFVTFHSEYGCLFRNDHSRAKLVSFNNFKYIVVAQYSDLNKSFVTFVIKIFAGLSD